MCAWIQYYTSQWLSLSTVQVDINKWRYLKYTNALVKIHLQVWINSIAQLVSSLMFQLNVLLEYFNLKKFSRLFMCPSLRNDYINFVGDQIWFYAIYVALCYILLLHSSLLWCKLCVRFFRNLLSKRDCVILKLSGNHYLCS